MLTRKVEMDIISIDQYKPTDQLIIAALMSRCVFIPIDEMLNEPIIIYWQKKELLNTLGGFYRKRLVGECISTVIELITENDSLNEIEPPKIEDVEKIIANLSLECVITGNNETYRGLLAFDFDDLNTSLLDFQTKKESNTTTEEENKDAEDERDDKLVRNIPESIEPNVVEESPPRRKSKSENQDKGEVA